MEGMEELALRRQADEALSQALANPVKAAIARVAYQMIIDGESADAVLAKIGKKHHTPKIDLAEERRKAIEANFRKLGFEISVPKPDVSNTTFKSWKREGRELFYRPATAEVSYEAWITAHGQAKHWTVTNVADRAKVGWEDATKGYWFTTEIAPACPRLKTHWIDLMAAVRLLSLEEYVIVYWTHCHLMSGAMIDISTWCWLRTRFGRGALSACDNGGGVRVSRCGGNELSISFGGGGGRAVEVVKNAA